MPLYFFHLQSGEIKVPDTKGREFSSTAEALFHAQMLVRKADIHLEQEDDQWIFRIQNANDDTEIVVLFPIRQPRSTDARQKKPPRWRH